MKRFLAGALAALVAFALELGLASPAAAQFADQAVYGGSTGGSVNAQTLSIPNVNSYPALQGVKLLFEVGSGLTNTGNVTLNVNGLGAEPVLDSNGNQLAAGTWRGSGSDVHSVVLIGGNFFDLTRPAVLNGALVTGTFQFQGCGAGVVETNSSGVVSCAPATVVPRAFLGGMILSNDGSSPNTVLDIAAGSAADSTNATFIALSAWTKSISGSFVAGSGANGMGASLTAAASTWYDVCAAIVSGVADVYFDTAVSGNTPCNQHPPSGVTAYRRIGSIVTDASTHIVAFQQDEATTYWKNSNGGFLDVAVTNLGTTSTLYTLTVPPGVKVRPISRFLEQNSNNALIISSPDEADVAPTVTTGTAPLYDMIYIGTTASDFALITPFLYTNVSGQIRARANGASTTLSVFTRGYIDNRGRYN